MDNKELCFARGPVDCVALHVKMRDCKGELCNFYKTDAQHAKDNIRTAKRIKKLTGGAGIEDKYHKWNRA